MVLVGDFFVREVDTNLYRYWSCDEKVIEVEKINCEMVGKYLLCRQYKTFVEQTY